MRYFIFCLFLFIFSCYDGITPLTPSIDIAYLKEDEDFVNRRMEDNELLPEKEIPFIEDESNFSFIIISDTHNASIGPFVSRQNIEAPFPQFIIINGDACNSASRENYLKNSIQFYSQEIPVIVGLGNHEIIYEGAWDYFKLFFGRSFFYFEKGTTLVICADTASGLLGSIQKQKIEDILQTTSCIHKIIVTHYNSASKDRANFELYNLCLQYNVNLVIFGHDHSFYYKSLGNTDLITLSKFNRDSSAIRINILQDKLYYADF